MKLLKENIIESLVYDYKDFIEHHFELNEDIDITEIDEDTYVMDFQIGENTYLLDIIDGNIVLVIDDEDHDISDPQLLYLYLSNDNPRYIKNKMHFGDRIPSDIPSRMSNATIDLYNQKMVENLLNRIKGKLLSENMFKPRNLEGREEQYRKILNKEFKAKYQSELTEYIIEWFPEEVDFNEWLCDEENICDKETDEDVNDSIENSLPLHIDLDHFIQTRTDLGMEWEEMYIPYLYKSLGELRYI